MEEEKDDNLSETSSLTESIPYGIEDIIRCLIFWESDDNTIGIIIQLCHHAFFYGMILWYIYLHTFSNSYLSFLAFYVIFSMIWFQYVFFNSCLLGEMEQKLLGNPPTPMDHLLQIFHITPEKGVHREVLLLVASLIMVMLSGEWLSRTIVGIANLF